MQRVVDIGLPQVRVSSLVVGFVLWNGMEWNRVISSCDPFRAVPVQDTHGSMTQRKELL